MAECPECGESVKVAPGKLTICPECDTKFRAPADDSDDKPVKKKPKKAVNKAPPPPPTPAPPPPPPDDLYGFSPDEEDLAEVRRKREEDEEKKSQEKKKEKPVIEVKRKNIGDLEKWRLTDRAMVWFMAGFWCWVVSHLLWGLVLFIGMIQGPELAGPMLGKLISADQQPMEIGYGENLDRAAFIVAMIGGMNVYGLTMTIMILMLVLGWARTGLWVTGGVITWPVAPPDSNGQGQLITLFSLGGVNFLCTFFLLFLPLIGAYSYCPVPWMGSEMAMAEYNMERTMPLHLFWAYSPFWEELFALLMLTLTLMEPIMIAYFTWSVAYTIKEEPLQNKAMGTVKMGFAVMFTLLVYQLFAMAGTSPVLVKVLRVLYLIGYVALLLFIMDLLRLMSRCRETFSFYFNPHAV